MKFSIYYGNQFQSSHQLNSKRGIKKIKSYPNLSWLVIKDSDGNVIPREEWEQWHESLYYHA